jgi:hypothetical protein
MKNSIHIKTTLRQTFDGARYQSVHILEDDKCATEKNIKCAFVHNIKTVFLYPPTTYKSLGVTEAVARNTLDSRLTVIDSMIDSAGIEGIINLYIIKSNMQGTFQTVKENYAKVTSELEELHTKISLVPESGGAQMPKKTK